MSELDVTWDFIFLIWGILGALNRPHQAGGKENT